ncbi:tetratricopeptide repeat protein 31-like isoform X3, partial [Dinothrombium tinctorium]
MSQSSDTNEGQSCERKPCEIAVNGLKVDLFRYLQRSRNQFASLGTDLASNEYYEDAIRFLTIAIHYNRYDHRLYFNRAFCLLEMDRNQDALKDINTCIALKNGWSKAYFKKGQILANMGEFIPAHKAYKI